MSKKKKNMLVAFCCMGALSLCAGFYLLGKKSVPAQVPSTHMIPYVLTAPVQQQDITPSKPYIALVEPINAVDIKPQVSGVIDKVLFEDGAMVQAGDSLFIIEQDRYQANVDIAQANLEKAKANIIQLQSDYNRQEKLYKQKFLPKAELEVIESTLNQAKASVKKAEADLKLALLDLEHTVIKAPITGRIGKALYTKGNYVDTSVSSLARLVQTSPIRIAFSITDKEHLDHFTRLQQGEEAKFAIALSLADGKKVDINPKKIFTDNEIDKKTATMSIYIEYENEEGLLTSGNYITVLISPAQKKKALLVPQSAILQDASGKYVMKALNNIAEKQYVEVGDNYQNMSIIEKGLSPTDTIIVSGAQKVQSGQTIKSTAAK